MIQPYSHIFFDIDGVLLSSVNYYAQLFKDIAEELGAPNDIPFSFYKKKVGTPLEDFLFLVVPEENHKKIRPLFESMNKESSDVSVFPMVHGAEDVLKKAKNLNKKVALVSSKSKEGIDYILQELSWNPYIDYRVSGHCVQNLKPDPEGLFKALDYFQAKSEDTLFIGDSFHDLYASRGANTNFLGVLTGVCNQEDWEKEKVSYISSVQSLL